MAKYDVTVSMEIDVPDDVSEDDIDEFIWDEVRPHQDHDFVVDSYRKIADR